MEQGDNKEQFIKDYMRSRVVSKTFIYSLFKKISNYENKFGKDACEFSKDEIIYMYTSFKSRSKMTLMNDNTVLKAYTEWYRYYKDKNNINNYNNINVYDLENCVEKNASKVMSYDDIIEIENSLLNYTDAAIIHALFLGISGPSMKDLTSIEEEMLDVNNKTITFKDNRIVSIDDRLVNLLQHAFDEEMYNTYGTTMIVKKLIGKGKLFKERDNCIGSLDTDDKKFRACYRKIRVIRDYLGIKEITMKGISSAGFLHYLKIGMSNTDTTLKEFLLTEEGNALMDRYGYTSKFRVDNVIYKYKNLI